MKFKISYILLSITVLGLFSCENSYYKLRTDWKKKTAPRLIASEQFTDCSGQERFCTYNCLKECVYEKIQCFSYNKGAYLVYAKCDSAMKKDTLIFMEFSTNPNYKKPGKKVLNAISPPYECLDKNYYRYIADGNCFFAPGHHFRATRIDIPVFVESDKSYTREESIDEIFCPTKWGFIEFWEWGMMRGTYKDGLKTGEWQRSLYNYPMEDSCYYQLRHQMEVCSFVNGKREGLSKEYYLYSLNDSSSWLLKPALEKHYKAGVLID